MLAEQCLQQQCLLAPTIYLHTLMHVDPAPANTPDFQILILLRELSPPLNDPGLLQVFSPPITLDRVPWARTLFPCLSTHAHHKIQNISSHTHTHTLMTPCFSPWLLHGIWCTKQLDEFRRQRRASSVDRSSHATRGRGGMCMSPSNSEGGNLELDSPRKGSIPCRVQSSGRLP